jgi:hypothetical protein
MQDRFLILIVVIVLTLLCLGSAGIIVYNSGDALTPHATRLFDACIQTFLLGVGAIFTLLSTRKSSR